MASYWDKVLQRRVSRRRALAATGTSVAAAAFLAACGGGDPDVAEPGDVTERDESGLLSPILNELDQARTGGTFVWANVREPVHFDGKAQGQAQLNVHNSLAYEALVRNKPGIGEGSTYAESLPELATEWEFSGDGLQLTLKLRDDVRFHDRPPVNGRLLDAEDVVKTWERYWTATTPNNAPANANALNPQAPILDMVAPDSRTIVITFAFPPSFILQRLANMVTGELGSIYPKEAAIDFNPEHDQIGTGPYELDEFTPSVRIVHRRFEGHWDPTHGFLDRIEFPLMPEAAAQLAQLRAGRLSSANVPADDVIVTKRDTPGLAMYGVTLTNTSPGLMMRFGWLPIDGQPTPFLDERVRQALSMSMDRETHVDLLVGNVTKFRDEGLPIEAYWHTAQGYVPNVWLNPQDAGTFGENARFYEYNVEEARALIQAAESSYGGTFPSIPTHPIVGIFGPLYTAETEVMDEYARAIGLDIVTTPIDYNLEALPNFVTKQGEFSGIYYGSGAVPSQHPIDYYLWRFYSNSGPTSGSLYGAESFMPDPEVDALIERGREEFDSEALITIIHDLQRILAKHAYTVARPGLADSFQLAWPAIRNFATFQGDTRTVLGGTWGLGNYWYDDTKAHG